MIATREEPNGYVLKPLVQRLGNHVKLDEADRAALYAQCCLILSGPRPCRAAIGKFSPFT